MGTAQRPTLSWASQPLGNKLLLVKAKRPLVAGNITEVPTIKKQKGSSTHHLLVHFPISSDSVQVWASNSWGLVGPVLGSHEGLCVQWGWVLLGGKVSARLPETTGPKGAGLRAGGPEVSELGLEGASRSLLSADLWSHTNELPGNNV